MRLIFYSPHYNDFVGFQLLWFVAVYGAAKGWGWAAWLVLAAMQLALDVVALARNAHPLKLAGYDGSAVNPVRGVPEKRGAGIACMDPLTDTYTRRATI